MSVSLQSLMVEVPVTRPKRSRLRKAGIVALIAVGLVAFLSLVLIVAAVKFVILHAGGLIAR